MGKYTAIPQNAFQGLQLDAGILLFNFNPETGEYNNSDIICATTGGINVVCQPTYSDFAADVDNAPNDLKEFKHLDGWQCRFSTTSIGTSLESIRLSLGAADIDSENSKITLRRQLAQSDFNDMIWWVGDRADGGTVAVGLRNALSTGGFNLQTTKNGKGQNSIEITGHVSLAAQNTMPMEFYSVDPLLTVLFDTDGGSEIEPQYIKSGGTVTEPTAPTKAENTFAGWYKDEELTTEWTFATDKVTEDTIIYAKWTPGT